jgi:hypothetical protein
MVGLVAILTGVIMLHGIVTFAREPVMRSLAVMSNIDMGIAYKDSVNYNKTYGKNTRH